MKDYATRIYIIAAVIVFVIAGLVIGLVIKLSGDLTKGAPIPGKTTVIAGDAAVVELVVIDGKVVHQPVSDFQAFIDKAAGPVFVDFWAPWCGPCVSAAPFVEKLAVEFDGQASFLKVDVDRADQLAQRFKVSSIPLFVVIKGGQIKDSMAGYAAGVEDSIRRMLQEQVGP